MRKVLFPLEEDSGWASAKEEETFFIVIATPLQLDGSQSKRKVFR
jgi:hypothetical protein